MYCVSALTLPSLGSESARTSLAVSWYVLPSLSFRNSGLSVSLSVAYFSPIVVFGSLTVYQPSSVSPVFTLSPASGLSNSVSVPSMKYFTLTAPPLSNNITPTLSGSVGNKPFVVTANEFQAAFFSLSSVLFAFARSVKRILSSGRFVLSPFSGAFISNVRVISCPLTKIVSSLSSNLKL